MPFVNNPANFYLGLMSYTPAGPLTDDNSLIACLTPWQETGRSRARHGDLTRTAFQSWKLGVDMIQRRIFRLCAQVVLVCLVACAAGAQVANNTSIVGTVADESGNVIVGVKVAAINEGTGIAYPGATNGEGYYSIGFLLAGAYDVVIEHPGFAKAVRKGIVVQSNQVVRADVVLRVGAIADVVTVEGTTPPISTDDATLSETLNVRSISDLPLNGRDALKLAATTSNVIVGPKSDITGIPPGEDFIGAGTREISNSLTLDGITIMNNLITVTSVTPNLDAIQEVQIQNGNYTAQYGSYMGVHVNLATKSGSNKVHGAVYEFVRNDLFDAHPFFDTPGSDKQPLRYNQFGMEVDGPVYSAQALRWPQQDVLYGVLRGATANQERLGKWDRPTPAMRSGDFSALLPTTQLFNPFTGLPFAGNIIPAQYMSPVSQALLKYMPVPQSGTTFNGFSPSNLTNNKTLERIDQSIGEKVRLFVRYDWENLTVLGGSGDPNPTNIVSGPANNSNIAFGYTHVFTPNLVNDFRFGRNHLVTNALNYFSIKGLKDAGTSLGIPGFTGDTTFGNPGIPDINIDGFMTPAMRAPTGFRTIQPGTDTIR